MYTFGDTLWFVLDRLFPLARPLSKAEADGQKARTSDELTHQAELVANLPKDPVVLREYLDECLKLLDEESDRRQGVEARLTSVMGLSSIAGTVLFSGIIAQATGAIHSQSGVFRWGMALGALYLTLQLCSAILAAVRGLSRKPFTVATGSVVLPVKDEDRTEYFRRRILWCLQTLVSHRPQNNDKVTEMAKAHCALTNFLIGLLLVALFCGWFAVRQNRGDDTIEMLQRSQKLHDLLRGPQGPAGPSGPKGDPGPPGANYKTPARTSPKN